MEILIVEDEKLSAQKLQRMLQVILPGGSNFKITDSVRSTLEYLKTQPNIDLGFFDIQLADGLSFSIFEDFRVPFPVIFTTAFNEYAIQAFKVNSIDYLLKPIDEKSLKHAMQQYNESKTDANHVLPEYSIAKALNMLTRQYKTRFLIKIGEHLRVINDSDISMIYSTEKSTYLKTKQDRDYPIDFSLEQLTELLDPDLFFRASRKFILSISSIKDIITYSGSRLKIRLNVSTEEDVLVSRNRVNEFKDWLGK